MTYHNHSWREVKPITEDDWRLVNPVIAQLVRHAWVTRKIALHVELTQTFEERGTIDHIRFTGIEGGGDPFDPLYREECDTCGHPYDVVVKAALCLCKAALGDLLRVWSSDRKPAQWADALDLAAEVAGHPIGLPFEPEDT